MRGYGFDLIASFLLHKIGFFVLTVSLPSIGSLDNVSLEETESQGWCDERPSQHYDVKKAAKITKESENVICLHLVYALDLVGSEEDLDVCSFMDWLLRRYPLVIDLVCALCVKFLLDLGSIEEVENLFLNLKRSLDEVDVLRHLLRRVQFEILLVLVVPVNHLFGAISVEVRLSRDEHDIEASFRDCGVIGASFFELTSFDYDLDIFENWRVKLPSNLYAFNS